MSIDSLEQIENTIGIHSGLNTPTVQDTIHKNIVDSPMAKALVLRWLAKQGLPEKTLRAALPASLAKAYNSRAYLRGWRNNVNPSWELLGGDNGEDNDISSEALELNLSAKADASRATASPPPAANNTPATEAWLKALFEQINKSVATLVEDKLSKTTLKLDDGAKAQIKQLAALAAQQRIDELAPPRRIEIADAKAGTVIAMGLQHERFPLLLKAMQARDHRGFRLNVWLTGPTGSGKTSACESAAKALSLPFGSDGSLDADYKVLGFRDANGHIISTQFLDIYENGGIYVADEIDNWMPSALLSLNAALANGWVSSPKGMIKRHADACVIACANTWGLGATGDYVGRTRLDAASLDRFQPKIDWPYDERLQAAIAQQMAGADGTDWHHTVVTARKLAATQGLKIIVSPRATFNGIALLAAGFDREAVIDMTIAAGISPEQKKAIGLASAPQAQQTVNEVIYDEADRLATGYKKAYRNY